MGGRNSVRLCPSSRSLEPSSHVRSAASLAELWLHVGYENAISGEANSAGVAAMPANSLLLVAIRECVTLLRIGADSTRWALFIRCCLARKTRDLNVPAAIPNSSQASSLDISSKYVIV